MECRDKVEGRDAMDCAESRLYACTLCTYIQHVEDDIQNMCMHYRNNAGACWWGMPKNVK